VLATGDELALPGEPLGPGGIVNSNAHALAAVVTACGGEAVVLPTVADDPAALAAAATAGAHGMDLFVTSGGASVGTYDLVQSALGTAGLVVDFWKVAMRPGKPLLFGRLGDVPMLGLPGNPVSSLVCALLFLWPAMERLCGLPAAGPPVSRATLTAPLAANDFRADHLRATLAEAADGSLRVTAFARQDSALLRLLAEAQALILRPAHAPPAPAGAEVSVIRLDRLGL
jgi:molybdopterin molybdotransferase